MELDLHVPYLSLKHQTVDCLFSKKYIKSIPNIKLAPLLLAIRSNVKYSTLINNVCSKVIEQRPMEIQYIKELLEPQDIMLLNLLKNHIPQTQFIRVIVRPPRSNNLKISKNKNVIVLHSFTSTPWATDFFYGYPIIAFGAYEISISDFFHFYSCPQCGSFIPNGINPDKSLEDDYQPLESPLTCGLPSTEEMNLFTVTRHPVPLKNGFQYGRIFEVFDTWTLYLFFILVFFRTIYFLAKVDDDSHWFGLQLVAVVWAVTSSSMFFFYNTDVRHTLIDPQLETATNALTKSDYRDKIIYTDTSYVGFFNEEVLSMLVFYQILRRWKSDTILLKNSTSIFQRLLQNPDEVLISNKRSFAISTQNFILSNAIDTWQWRQSSVNIAEKGQRKAFIHDKNNPHLARVADFVLRATAASLISKAQKVTYAFDPTINPYTIKYSNYTLLPLSSRNLTQVFLIFFIGLFISSIVLCYEKGIPRTKRLKLKLIILRSYKTVKAMRVVVCLPLIICVLQLVFYTCAPLFTQTPKPLFAFGTANVPLPNNNRRYYENELGPTKSMVRIKETYVNLFDPHFCITICQLLVICIGNHLCLRLR